MKKTTRRTFIQSSFWGGTLALISGTTKASDPTPNEIEGPFYPVVAQKDKDFDLTKIKGNDGMAKGQVVYIEGRVLDTNNQPIENATVDIWQANAAGKYNHPLDSYDAPLDPNFQGWAIVQSGKKGRFKFKTIVPGTYPATDSWTRPPHIHFKVTKKGFVEITTQMYFPGHELNATDQLLKRKNKSQQAQMIAINVNGKKDTLGYDIVMQEV